MRHYVQDLDVLQVPRILAASLLGLAVLLSGCGTGVPAPAATADRGVTRPAVGGAPAPVVVREAPQRVLARVRIAAVGDVMVHRAVKESAAAADQREGERSLNFGGYRALFADVAPDLRAADIAFANLETPVVRRPEIRPYRINRYRWRNRFHAPPELLGALRATGIHVVSLANNHIYDQGRAGLEATLDEVATAGLQAVGVGKTRAEAEQPVVVEVQGVRVALLGYAEFFNIPILEPDQWDSAWANRIDPDRMVEAVRSARRGADFVVVSLHWGIEYTPAPQRWQIDLAHRLLDAGADVILGHHPHVLQPIEVYRTDDGRAGLVIYSLGNFISNQGWLYAHGSTPERVAETRDGVLLWIVAEKRDYGAGLVRTEVAEVRYLPLWTDNDTLDRRGPVPATIRVVPIERALDATRTQVARLLVTKDTTDFTEEQAAGYVGLQVRLDMLLQRKAAIAKRLGEKYLAEP